MILLISRRPQIIHILLLIGLDWGEQKIEGGFLLVGLSPLTAKMSCSARILDKEYAIPGLTETCHSTKECGEKANKKIVIDNGDSSLYICNSCMRRYLTKKSADSTWYGWFDCEYPAAAKVMYSAWFYDAVKRGSASASSSASAAQAAIASGAEVGAVDKLTEQMAELTLTKEKSILQQISEINMWMKGEGKNNYKEQVVKQRELIELKTRLKLKR